jgi:hypothetical protein
MKARVAREASQEAQSRQQRAAELARSAEVQQKARIRKASQLEQRNLETLNELLHDLRAELVQAASDGYQFIRAPAIFKKIAAVATKLHTAKTDLSDDLPFLPPCLAPFQEKTSFGVLACDRYLLVLKATLASLDRRVASLVEDPYGTLPKPVQALLFELINASAQRQTLPSTSLLREINLRKQPGALKLGRYLDERDLLAKQIDSLSKSEIPDVAIAWDLNLPKVVHEIYKPEDYEPIGQDLFSPPSRIHGFDPGVSEDPLFHPRLLRRAAEYRIRSLLKWILDHVEQAASAGGAALEFEMSQVILKDVDEPRDCNELADALKLLTLLGFELAPQPDEVGAMTDHLKGAAVRTSDHPHLYIAWG